MSERVAVIGGGITGLSAAYRLRQAAPTASVTLFERRSRFGGTIVSEHVDGFVLEGGPDSFLAVKPRGVGLSEELGISERLLSSPERGAGAFILRNGKLLPLPPGLTSLARVKPTQILRSPLLGLRGKLRLILEPLIRTRLGSADESVSSFFTRRLGRDVSRNLMEPLLTGIYGGDGEQLSLAATFANWRTAELTHGSLTRGMIATRRESRGRRADQQGPRPTFASFRDGMADLVDALCRQLDASGVQRVSGATVTSLERDEADDSYRLGFEEDGLAAQRFDAVILAIPAWAAARLVTPLDRDAGDALSEIPHVSSAIVVVTLPKTAVPHPLDGSGYISPRAEGRPIMAMTWLSSKWPHRAPADQVVLRGFVGRSGQQEVLEGDDASLIALMIDEMREVLGVTSPPITTRVFRWPVAMPQYTLGHLDRVRRITDGATRIPGLELAGNMFQGVGIPDCIASGELAATNTASYLRERRDHNAASAAS